MLNRQYIKISVNEASTICGFSQYGNYTVIWLLLCITDVLAAFIGKRDSDTVTTPFWECASTERQRFLVS